MHGRVIVGALLVVGSLAVPGGAQARPDNALRSDVAYLTQQYGISESDAAFRIGLEEDIGRLQVAARAWWPRTFAGMWIEHADGGTVHVAFTKDAAANVARLRRSFVAPELLRAETAARSLAELEARKERMVADRELARAHRLAIPGVRGAEYHLDIDVRQNSLVFLATDPTAATAEAVRSRYGADVRIERAGDAGPETCALNDCRYSMRSGLKISHPSIGYCTTAFASSTSGAMFTAGHCNVFGSDLTHGGEAYGRTDSFREFGNTDAATQVMYSPFYGTSSIRTGNTAFTRVTGTGLYTSMVVGNVVTKAGATTGVTSGSVTSTNFSPSWITGGTQFIKTDYCAEGGDSGSGVYRGNTAVGIHSGGSSGTCATGHYSAFGHIQFAQSALGHTVKTSEPAPDFLAVTDATHGVATVSVRFSKPVSCGSVSPSDFRARLSNLTTVTNLTVTGVSGCGTDSDPTMVLSLNPAPVFGTTLEVSVVSHIADAMNNSVPFATRSVPVAL